MLVHCFDVFSALRPAFELKCSHLLDLTSNSRPSKLQRQRATESRAVIEMSKQGAGGVKGGVVQHYYYYNTTQHMWLHRVEIKICFQKSFFR